MYKPFTAATAELTEEQNLDILHLFGFELIYKVLPMCTMDTYIYIFFFAKVPFVVFFAIFSSPLEATES